MNASLIIPTYNKLPRLKLLLASLKAQTCSFEKFEVIIINDQSTDGTKEYLETLKTDFLVRVINKNHSGRAKTRNAGLKLAQNEIIIFVDDDLILSPNFIENHLIRQSQNMSIVHGKIVNLSYLKFFEDPSYGELYSGIEMNESKIISLKKQCITEADIVNRFDTKVAKNKKCTLYEKMIHILLTDYKGKADWIAFSGGNISVPQKWLQKIDGFDEQFGLEWGCEDLELGYRLFKLQKPIEYLDNAVNYHIAHYRSGFKEEHRKNIAYFYDKHKDPNILLLQDFVDEKISMNTFFDMLVE